MAQSIKTNYIYNLINTVSGLLFPLITFPYSSRIIQADGIGLVSFYQGIIDYIVLFSSLGIPIYAIREIARVRDDKDKLNVTALEILILHLILTIIGYLVIVILGYSVDRIYENLSLYALLSISVILGTIGCGWFYAGIEDFKFITIRGLIIRVICVCSLFVFVKDKSDLIPYAIVTSLGSVGNNIVNFIYLRKYLNPFKVLTQLRPFRHLLPALKIFALNLVISIYVNLDSVMLGFLSTNTAVGYYTGATKLTKMVLGIVTSLQTIMIPRCSYLAKKDSLDEFYEVIQKALDYVLTINIPLSIGLCVMAPTLINLFCGPTYQPAILTLEIISPIIFMISMSGIPCYQVLYPLGHETVAIASTAIGACVNFSLNWMLIPKFGENGAAIATVIAETIVTISMYYVSRKYIRFKRYDIHYLNCIIGGFLMLLALVLIRIYVKVDWINLFLMPFIGAVVYAGYLYIRRDSFINYLRTIVLSKFNKNGK